MEIAILLFDRLTALDAIGPYEVLSRIPSATIKMVAKQAGPLRNDTGSLALVADYTLKQVPAPDIFVVPGGPGQMALMDDEEVLNWVRRAHATSKWTASVCTGSLVLGAAGLLKDLKATSHWLAYDALRALGAEPTEQRVVIAGKIITAAGVSAGIDMALTLAARVCGEAVAQAIQLGIEYDPQPPFDAGSPGKAPPAIVERLRARSRFILQGQ
ncbi:MAG: DJ-1/PfpI family protein [Acidobacteria bacterium]|nr:DJ-1/PfpI family protein [Acidobacteriota bacterium]MBI3422092.1 DJ-1/PfpI family protein [Acidobacteriota bacterium]